MFAAFQRLLNPYQVYSLLEGGPLLGYVKIPPSIARKLYVETSSHPKSLKLQESCSLSRNYFLRLLCPRELTEAELIEP